MFADHCAFQRQNKKQADQKRAGKIDKKSGKRKRRKNLGKKLIKEISRNCSERSARRNHEIFFERIHVFEFTSFVENV